MDEEELPSDVDNDELDAENICSQVADLLAEAGVAVEAHVRVDRLRKASAMILTGDTTLLDNFLEEMIAFKSDRAAEVRKFVAEFIEESTKVDVNLLTTFLPLVALFLGDTNSGVIKRAILCHAQLYKVTLRWIAGMKGNVEEKTRIIWNTVVTMKDQIFRLLESTNQGIRSHVIKFMEHIALALSHKTTDSESCRINDLDVSLDLVKTTHSYLRYSDLKLEGSKIIQVFLTLITSPQVTCSNLLVALNCLVAIARQRPIYMPPVIQSLESIHVNLPPSLSKSQVASVRKNLKLQLSQLVKHTAIAPYISQISTLMTDLGSTQSELNKMIPRSIREAAAKLKKEKEDLQMIKPTSKKSRLDEESLRASSGIELEQNKRVAAIEITTEYLMPRLKRPETVANIVLLSMLNLPNSIPAHFQSTYTPIDSAGTPAQIEHLARLMATQMTAAGVGVGVDKIAKEESKMAAAKKVAAAEESLKESETKKAAHTSSSEHANRFHHSNPANGEKMLDEIVETDKQQSNDTKQTLFTPETLAANLQMRDPAKRNVKAFNFREATFTIAHDQLNLYAKNSLKRILYAEKKINQCGANAERFRVLTNLAIMHEDSEFNEEIESFVLEDLKSSYELIMSWLYQLYNRMQRTANNAANKVFLQQYERVVMRVMKHVMQSPEKEGTFLTKLFIAAPILTNTIFSTLSRYCTVEDSVSLCIATLSEVVLKRSSHMKVALNYLLLLTTLDHQKARTEALKLLIHLYSKDTTDQYKSAMENFATMRMESVMDESPPYDLLDKSGRPYSSWNEDAIKQCLFLYLGLLPLNHSLLLPIATNFTLCSSDVKRTLLRIMEAPIYSMGQDSPEIHRLLQSCPQGCETLLIRILHVLTESKEASISTSASKISPQLLSNVKALYKENGDVRFLIPVLSALSKFEVLEALPKFVKLAPELFKEVYKRLTTIFFNNAESPNINPILPAVASRLTAVDVFVALHKIEGADLKNAISAVNTCVADENVFNESVMAISLTQILEMKTLPTLVMRTVLQALGRHQKLRTFVLNTVLQRLIVRQVWKFPKLWDGFIRCVQKTTPDSYGILLQLPSEQLINVFNTSDGLKTGLLSHWKSLPEYQRNQVLPSLQQLLNSSNPGSRSANQSNNESGASEPSEKETSRKRSLVSADQSLDDSGLNISASCDPDDSLSVEESKKMKPDVEFSPEVFAEMMERLCSEIVESLCDEVSDADSALCAEEVFNEIPTEYFIYNDLIENFLSDEAFSVALESKTELELRS